MEEWMVMGGAMLLICLFYPPFLGFIMGMGFMMLATYIVFKIIGG